MIYHNHKITTEEPQDSDVVNWNGTKEILTQQVYALRYTTVESKKYNIKLSGDEALYAALHQSYDRILSPPSYLQYMKRKFKQ
jgi:hypothetical protein